VSYLPIDPDLAPDDPGEPSKEHRAVAPRASGVRRGDPAVLAQIGVGGFLGALARYEVGLTFPAPPGGFPTAIFVINTSGAFAIGLVLALILERFPRKAFLRPLICVGFLGAWTTVSTVCSDSVLLVRDSRALLAAGYIVATIVCGLAATLLGVGLGRRFPFPGSRVETSKADSKGCGGQG
jgi:fluoride exporter